MYGRFWSGPPNDYPYIYVGGGLDYAVQKEEKKEQQMLDAIRNRYVGYELRDKNYIEAFYRVKALYDANLDFSKPVVSVNTKIYKFLQNIRALDYDWISGTIRISNVNLLVLYEKSIKDQACILDISDRGIKTVFVYYTRILGLSLDDFNLSLSLKAGIEYKFRPTLMNITNHIDPNYRYEKYF